MRGAGTAYETPAPQAASASVRTLPQTLVVVDVVGAVRRAGLYRLPQGSRIADALARAGGATPKADLDLVNLAAPLTDGSQITVPKRAAPGQASEGEPASPSGPVHLNTATEADLDALP